MEQRTPITFAARGYRARLVGTDGATVTMVTVVQTLDGPVSVPDDWPAWHAAQTATRDYVAVPLEG